MEKFRLLFISLLLGASVAFSLLSVSPDQTNLGILITENKDNLQFIGVVVSNLVPAVEGAEPGSKEVPKIEDPYYKRLRLVNQLDFNGNMWFLQNNYSLAFRQLRLGQGEMKDLYQLATEKYIEDTRALLESVAPNILRNEDAIAKHLLKLGFRDLRNAEDNYSIAFNSSPYQYRYKLLLYNEGLKTLRRARRFAVLSLIANKTHDEDKPEYQFMSLEDIQKAKEKDIVTLTAYEKIRNTLTNYIQMKRLEPKITPAGSRAGVKPLDLLEIHDDNYGVITNGRLDLLIVANRELKETDARDRESLPPVPQKPAPTDATSGQGK